MDTRTCPRCTEPLDLPGRSRLNRDRSTEICGDCCTNEAVRDARHLPPIPPGDWPVTSNLTWNSR